MDKRLVYVFVILLVVLFVINGCEEYVGGKVDIINKQGLTEDSIRELVDYEFLSEFNKVNEISQIEMPNIGPRRDWVVGLQCGGVITEELIEENDGEREFAITEPMICDEQPYGIVIAANDVTLRCFGDGRIQGPYENYEEYFDNRRHNPSFYGIYVYKESENVRIIGCDISQFLIGIHVRNSTNIEILENNIHDTNQGIYLLQSRNSIIEDNEITDGWEGRDNSPIGIKIADVPPQIEEERKCYDNRISDNDISRHVLGVLLGGWCTENILEGNIIGNNEEGIGVGGESNTIRENVVNNNEYKGISIYGDSNIIISNDVNDNLVGIYLPRTDQNRVERNTLRDNVIGISLYYSDQNNIERNTLNGGSIGVDLRDDGFENTIQRNTISNFREYGILSVCLRDNEGNIVSCPRRNTISTNTITNGGFVCEGCSGIALIGPTSNNILLRNNLQNNNNGINLREALDNNIRSNTICNNENSDIICNDVYEGDVLRSNKCENVERDNCRVNINCSPCRILPRTTNRRFAFEF